jgi:hypothetical protein
MHTTQSTNLIYLKRDIYSYKTLSKTTRDLRKAIPSFRAFENGPIRAMCDRCSVRRSGACHSHHITCKSSFIGIAQAYARGQWILLHKWMPKSKMSFRAKGSSSSSRRSRPTGGYPAVVSPSSTNNNRPVRPSPLSFSANQNVNVNVSETEDMSGLQSPAMAPEGQQQILETLQTFPLFKDAPEDFLNRVAKKLRPQVHMPRDEIVCFVYGGD